MKASQLISASALAATALAADAAEIEFLTVLVNDLKANEASYLGYVATATGVPAGVTALALEVQTYTDDSYTTLLDAGNIDVAAIEAFAKALPWYSRIEAAITPLAETTAASSTAAASSSAAETSAASSSAAETSAASSSHASSSSAAASSSAAVVSTADSGASNSAIGVTLLTVGSLIACLF